MSGTRIPIDEFVRQLRAAGPTLVERWIAAALASPETVPTEFEVGDVVRLVLTVAVLPMGAPAPRRITCDDCHASLEFPSDATQEGVARALLRRGWTAMPESLLCPQCKATTAARN